jgi:hypothetical protein
MITASTVGAAAANFEIVPVHRVQTVRPDTEEWQAVLFNYRDNRAFNCNAIYRPRDAKNPMSGQCIEIQEYGTASHLGKGADVQSVYFPTLPDRAFSDGIWQVDKQNGAVQFCVAMNQPLHCIDLTPK